MKDFHEIVPSIHRLTIPFENIYTTVFIIKTPLGAILFDTATYESDVDDYILPAFHELRGSQDALRYIVLSHSHRDHAGGLDRLLEFFPETCIISGCPDLRGRFSGFRILSPEEQPLLHDCIELIALPGHAPDCLAIYDRRSRALLTGDSLQLSGIYGSGKWGANITQLKEHLQAIEKLRTLNTDILIASHDYHPCGFIARGKTEISRYLDECIAALHKVRETLMNCPDLDDQAAADYYNRITGLPPIGLHVARAVRSAAKNGVF